VKTKINDAIVEFEFTGYDKHLHGKLTNGKKPFMIGYISIVSDEVFEPVKDYITVAVDIQLVDGIYPKFRMSVIDKEEFDEIQAPCGGFTNESIDFMLADLCDAICYHELGETINY